MQHHAGIIDILNRLHHDIRALELAQGLLFSNNDMRPRIEYFHDAVRALTSGPPARLSVEKLSYDVEGLRYLQAHPLGSLHARATPAPGRQLHPGSTQLGPTGLPPRELKARLSELYQQYGVLFASLLRPNADNDFHDRAEDLNDRVAQLHATSNARGNRALMDSALHIADAALRAQVLHLLQSGKTKEALALMKDAATRTDTDLKTLDNAHSRYAMAQLGLYEAGKDVLKKLAGNGMNLAGRFVESAMASAKGGARGR